MRYRIYATVDLVVVALSAASVLTDLLRLRNAIATAIEEADASHDDTVFVVRLINLCGLSFGGSYTAAAKEIRSLGDRA